MTVENFVLIEWTNFERIEEKVVFWSFLTIFLRSQSHDFDAIAHAGAPLGVE